MRHHNDNGDVREVGSQPQLILDSVPAAIWYKDAHNRFLKVNKAAAESIGRTKEQIEGKTCEDIFPNEAAHYYADDLEVIRSGRPKLGIAELQQTASGEKKWMRTDKIPYFDEQGSVAGVIVFALDITELKQAQERIEVANIRLSQVLQELKRTQEQVLQHERLNALGHMASGVAHDFNNALMPILGFTDLLLNTPDILDDRKETVEMLEQIRLGAVDAADTVSRLRDFYRAPDRTLYKPVDLSCAIRDAVAFTKPKWKEEMEAEGIDVNMQTEIEKTPLVAGNEHELIRLLTNLIFNAIEALHASGSVTIRLHPHVSKKAAVIELTDTGVGMTEAVRRRCFDPFFTTKGGRGVGLGLSVAHGIVQRHKGSIEIQSRPDKGTKVIIQLPIAESQIPAPISKEPLISNLPPVQSLRILFVDDEESARRLVSRYLEADGHRVTVAIDGQEGLKSFGSEHFDAVILDRAMPKMSGDDLAAAIKKISPRTPVIMLTGFGDTMRDHDEHPAGVDVIVPKPVTRDDLRQALTKAMVGFGGVKEKS
jgi:PAS domain S-box-containing protein